MVSEIKIVGNVLGQGRSEDILVVSTIEKAGSLRKGTIVAHDTTNEVVLMEAVAKITWADISQEDLYLMNENEPLGSKIIQRYPRGYILRCNVVGALRNENDMRRIYSEPISFIADKTSEVRTLYPEERKSIFERGSLSLGKTLDGFKISFKINDILQRHLSIIGMTGSGKSYLVGLLCEELIQNNGVILVLDPHNEYLPMAQSLPTNKRKMLYSLEPEIGLNKYTLDVKKLTARDFQHFTGMGDGSTSILEHTINNLRKFTPDYTTSDIIQKLNRIANPEKPSSEGVAALWARNYLRNLFNTGFIGTSEPSIREMVAINQISVLAMSGIRERIQQFVVANILQRIFKARKNEEIPPLVLIVEEAHRFAPATANVASTQIMRTLAAEGRKFGICLVVVSQRPNRLDSTALSQCVTNIVMKIKNPADLTRIRESAENVTEHLLNQLPKFERGEAIIMGEAFPISLRFKVRSDRKTKHGGKSVDFKGIWSDQNELTKAENFEFPDEF